MMKRLASITLTEDDAAAIKFAVARAGFDPDECTVTTAPVRDSDDITVCRVRVPGGRTLRVSY